MIAPTKDPQEVSAREVFDGPAPCPSRRAAGPRLTRIDVRVHHLLLLIVLVAGALRFYRPESWPVFLDEDGYTRAALELMVPWDEALRRAFDAAYGKPPLAFFLQAWLVPLTGDLVVAGRVLSAASGTVTTVLCFFLGRRLGGPPVGLVAATIYGLSPIAVLHERMVLQDGPLTASATGALLMSCAAIERGSWRLGSVAAILGAVAVQFKVPGVVVAVLPLASLSIPGCPLRRRAGPAVLAAIGPVASYGGLMWGPMGPGLAGQNHDRMAEPFSHFGALSQELLRTAKAYFPAGLGALIVIGLVLALQYKPRLGAVFVTAVLGWSLPWLILANFAPSRYYLPAVPYLCGFAGLALVRLLSAAATLGRGPAGLVGAVAAAIVAASGIASIQLAVSHRTAPMSAEDDGQYRTGWTSGYGYTKAAYFVSAMAEPGSAVAYVVDPLHRVGVGFGRPSPTGVKILGLFHPPDQLRINYSGPVYVVADDGLDTLAGRRVAEVLARQPGLHTLVRYTRPGSDLGVSVLWRPPLPE
jgi:hypothetical protein